ncbi:MAG TPA: high-affinity branched-chain amino acid ABC transporter permease LivM [Hyphomicrobiaceae bacterium]|nr:high-affinity branched-chain amino acid ABC transporter permease LivM [Hyphomicrobiaceae bacterium]
MLALGVPILLLRTDQDMSNRLVLLPRFGLLAYAVVIGWALGLMRHLGARGRIVFAGLVGLAGYAVKMAAGDGDTIGGFRVDLLAPALSSFGILVVGLLCVTALYLAARSVPESTVERTALHVPEAVEIWGPRVGLLLLAAYPLLALMFAGSAGSIKWIDNFGIQIMIYIMLGWGLNIVVGLAGLLDLGYVAFYAVGAYAYALLATSVIPNTIPELGPWAFWICLPIAGILAAMWGVLLGFPVLRLRGDYLAIVTLAFGEIIRLVLINWIDFTNGYAGISGIPRPSFFGFPFNASDEGFAATFGLEFTPLHRTIFLFYVILALALLTNWATVRLRRLPIGRAWEALREDEIACRSLGINTTNTKLTAFAIGAMFGGFAGSFFAARQGFISPESFTFMESAVILAIVVLGGMGSQVGVAIAAVAMIGGTELLRELDWLKTIFGNDFDPTQYRMLLFGLAMVVLMIWKPRGLISTRAPTVYLKERKAVSGDLVKEGHG